MLSVDEELYSPQQVADYLQVSVHTVYRWLKDGEMGAIRFRREYRIRESDLREFIESHSQRPERDD
jgi:excisionase family DNA binding protein